MISRDENVCGRCDNMKNVTCKKMEKKNDKRKGNGGKNKNWLTLIVFPQTVYSNLPRTLCGSQLAFFFNIVYFFIARTYPPPAFSAQGAYLFFIYLFIHYYIYIYLFKACFSPQPLLLGSEKVIAANAKLTACYDCFSAVSYVSPSFH